ncbi:hypothetical protein [Paludisphaera soli]|uniref:hypothetical protein n=1 Tax=Paludisphaera soli TaxID=2712865 RepID=UPI0013E9D93C|nr:hypothetical protein [Paludisphaera soli]
MTTHRRAAAFSLLICASVLLTAPTPARGDFMFGSTPNPPQSPTGYAESNETFTWFWEWNGEEPPFGEVFFADLFPHGRSQYDEPGALWRVQITAIRQPPNSFFRFQIRAQHASQADSSTSC